MFNGIIKNKGKIYKIKKNRKNCTLYIDSNIKLSKKDIGESISCSGTCLTLEGFKKNIIRFYISKETLKKTNFKYAKIGDLINLEKSLKFGDPVSGHFVQGHVDNTAKIKKIIKVGKSWYINFKLSKKYMKYIITKGSVAINGVSLTVSKIFTDGFQTVLIPHTLKLTNLILLKKNDFANVEFDILIKYIKKTLK